MRVSPYLYFDGRCDEAIAFYQRAVGAQVKVLLRFKDAPSDGPGPAMPPDGVMHAGLRIGDSDVFVSDGRCGKGTGAAPAFDGFGLSLTVPDAAAAERAFAALGDGGQVRMPLGKTFFSPCYGMVSDRFGVSWMVYAGQ